MASMNVSACLCLSGPLLAHLSDGSLFLRLVSVGPEGLVGPLIGAKRERRVINTTGHFVLSIKQLSMTRG